MRTVTLVMVTVLATLLGIMTAGATKTPPEGGCYCTAEHKPVCACDGGKLVEYGNYCKFECANRTKHAKIVYEGPCKKYAFQQCDNDCPSTFQPVCASDRKEYASDCSVKCHRIFLEKKGLYVLHQGRCKW